MATSKSEAVLLRMTKEERKWLQSLANESGMSVSQWLRCQIIQAWKSNGKH